MMTTNDERLFINKITFMEIEVSSLINYNINIT
jgi:hypothetical protein